MFSVSKEDVVREETAENRESKEAGEDERARLTVLAYYCPN
jgi:hypothetical protein